MGRTAKAKTDTSKWPAKYDLEESDGKAILDRDFFPTCCPSQLDDAWAARTVHFRPYFEVAAVKSGIVDKNHECGKNNRKNVALWKAMAQKVILGKKYRDHMKSGWNKAIEALTKSNGSDAIGGVSGDGSAFSFRGKAPISQADVGSILFGPDVCELVNSGSLEQPMALLFMWGYYLTMEGCSYKWELESTNQYIQDNKWNVVLGNKCAGEKSMTIHGWLRVGTKMAVNSFQTYLRKQQKKCWGVVFQGSLIIKEGVQTDEKGRDLEIVDIGDYLPAKVKTDMSRVSITKFIVERIHGETLDAGQLMRIKVSNLYCWADEEELSREEVYKVMTEMKDKKTGSGSGDPIRRLVQQNIEVSQKVLAQTRQEIQNNATMSPHPNRSPGKATKKDGSGKGSKEKEDNTVRTKTVLSSYLKNSEKVSVLFLLMY